MIYISILIYNLCLEGLEGARAVAAEVGPVHGGFVVEDGAHGNYTGPGTCLGRSRI